MDIDQYAREHPHFQLQEIPELLKTAIGQGRYGSLADIGCGDGALLHALKGAGLLEGKTVWAVDLSPERLKRVQQFGEGFRCVVASACDLGQIPDGAVDLLTTTQVIEHVEDDARMIAEMYRVLSPGAEAFLSTVFRKWYGWYFRRCNGRWRLDPTHVREYTRDEELLGLLSRQGFEVIQSRKAPIAYPLIDPLVRMLGGSAGIYAKNRWLRRLRSAHLPIPGYYNWEILLRKPR